MRKLGFDPSAEVLYKERYELAEVTLESDDDGRIFLTAWRDGDERRIAAIKLRPGFLDAFLAQARESEVDAA